MRRLAQIRPCTAAVFQCLAPLGVRYLGTAAGAKAKTGRGAGSHESHSADKCKWQATTGQDLLPTAHNIEPCEAFSPFQSPMPTMEVHSRVRILSPNVRQKQKRAQSNWAKEKPLARVSLTFYSQPLHSFLLIGSNTNTGVVSTIPVRPCRSDASLGGSPDSSISVGTVSIT